MNRFADKTVLITGAAHGIGLACARRLAAEGARVALTDVDTAAAVDAARQLPDAIAVTCDVTDPGSVAAATGEVADRLGGIDVLVNNVGVAAPIPFLELDDAGWARQTDPTLNGAVRAVQQAIPHLLRAPGGGAVVSISSVNGMSAIGLAAYSAAKAGLINLSRLLAVEYSPRRRDAVGADHGWIRFNVVSPGTIHTRVWDKDDQQKASMRRLEQAYPMGRVGQPDDIAAAVAFLAGPDAAWITGINLPVEGGFLAGPATFLPGLTT